MKGIHLNAILTIWVIMTWMQLMQLQVQAKDGTAACIG